MSSHNAFLAKAILFYAFILFQFYNMKQNNIVDLNYIVFQCTIGKYSLCIFYGYIILLLDMSDLKLSWNIWEVIRYRNRISWCINSLKKIFIKQFFSIVLILVFLILSAIIFQFHIVFTKEIWTYCFTLFIYLLFINMMVAVAMSIVRDLKVSIIWGFLINTVFLILEHYYFYMEEKYAEFLTVIFVILFIAIGTCFIFMLKRDLYTNRKTLYVNLD